MKIFIDCEFVEYPGTLELFSIGLAAENGATYYANVEYPLQALLSAPQGTQDWLQINVLDQRFEYLDPDAEEKPSLEKKPRKTVAKEIQAWVAEQTDNPEFCGYFCVAPETEILTSDLRWVTAGSIRQGDVLAGFDENTTSGKGRSNKWRGWRKSTVTHAETVTRPCYDLTFSDGTRVRCSAEHRWLTASGKAAKWMETQNLYCGKESSSNVVKPVDKWELNNSRGAGYLAAAFDGEGCLQLRDLSSTQGQFQSRISFSQKQNSMLKEVKRLLEAEGFGYSTCHRKKDDLCTVHISNRHDMLRFIGSVRPLRLLDLFDISRIGAISMNTVKLVEKVFVGEQKVIALSTDTKTYIAEGLASHNCDYDWVLFCWLFGSMINLPEGYPMYCWDLKQYLDEHGIPRELQPENVKPHHALADAIQELGYYQAAKSWVESQSKS